MKNIFLIIFIGLIYSGCGGGVTTSTVQQQDNSRLNENNYIDIAQYYYLTQLTNKKVGTNNLRAHAFPAETAEDRNLENRFEVEAITPLGKYVKELNIKYNQNNILLKVNTDTEKIEIEYLENNTQKQSISMTLEEFINHGIEEQYRRDI